jgi:hypothetical protein
MSKIKCDWITCAYNSSKCEYRGVEDSGDCLCEDEVIVFTTDNECDNCGASIDGLQCNSYVPKSSGKLN